MPTLRTIYPWIRHPLIVSAPMLGAATPALAMQVSKAGGIGFIAGGTSASGLKAACEETAKLQRSSCFAASGLPIGIGFQLFNTPPSDELMAVLRRYEPAVIWLFAPREMADVHAWADQVRSVTAGRSKVWVQVGSVSEARKAVAHSSVDVLVMQGSDAGGHGLCRSASIVTLVPETLDMLADEGRADVPVLAAGGIVEGRGAAASLALGASGVVMGTRFLAAEEAGIAKGWQEHILCTGDGGISTMRSTLCDRLKETKGWPAWYDGRAVRNRGHEDEEAGMSDPENVLRYQQELQNGNNSWGAHGRMVTYAGTAVGLVQDVQPAARIVEEVRLTAGKVLKRTAASFGSSGASEKL